MAFSRIEVKEEDEKEREINNITTFHPRVCAHEGYYIIYSHTKDGAQFKFVIYTSVENIES